MREDTEKVKLNRLRILCSTETNIMLAGATGCGKSSTINALFACGQTEADYIEVAMAGSKPNPETRDIEKYRIGNLILWDTPGLGDGTEIDEHHKTVIREMWQEEDEEEDYKEQVAESFGSMADYVTEGINSGAEKSFLFLGIPGAVAGTVTGAFAGGIKGILSHIF